MVIKLRKEGRGPDDEHVRVVGRITREGRTVSSGRVGAWFQREEFDRVNAGVQRGRTVPSPRFEMYHATVHPNGAYAIEGLKLDQGRPGRWFLAFEEPGHAPLILATPAPMAGENERTIDLNTVEGGSIAGIVEHVPKAMGGQVWVVAFSENIVRRETRVGRDGTFRLDDLPPGRYGVKVGHDAYRDPHIPKVPALGEPRTPEDLAAWKKKAEPWQGAVVAVVRSGATTSDVRLDFRPPGPLVDK